MTATAADPMTLTATETKPWVLTGSGVAARGGAFLVLGLVLVAPYFTTDFAKSCTLAAIYALMALSLNIIVGYTGQLSLGHQGFLGLGAIVTANVCGASGQPAYIGILLGILATTVMAIALGLVALRITGLYLSLITLVFGSAISSSLFALPSLTNNNSGQTVNRAAYLADNGRWYLVCLAAVLVVYYLDSRLTKSKTGRALLAIKENERVAEAFGVGVTSYKLLAFALSGAIAGLAGGLFAFYNQIFAQQDFQDPNGFSLALLFVVMCVVGGLGNRLGVVVAGAFFALINDLLDALFTWHPFMSVAKHIPVLNGYYGQNKAALASLIGALLLLQTLIFNPGGLGGQLRPIARWMSGRKFDLHEAVESGPAAVEGSSVRA